MKFTPWNYALNLLSRREYSIYELQQKVTLKFPDLDSDEQIELVQRLKVSGLACDERFSEMWARTRYSQGKGPIRIRQELKQKGISETQIETALEQESFDWYQLALTTKRKKFNQPAQDHKEKAKIYRFLSYRGFNSEQIQYAMDCD